MYVDVKIQRNPLSLLSGWHDRDAWWRMNDEKEDIDWKIGRKPSQLNGCTKDSLKTLCDASVSPCMLSGVVRVLLLEIINTGSSGNFRTAEPIYKYTDDDNVQKLLNVVLFKFGSGSSN